MPETPSFDPEAHFNSHMSGKTIRDHGILLSLSSYVPEKKEKLRARGRTRVVPPETVNGDAVSFQSLERLRALSASYLSDLLGSLSGKARAVALYTADLTGALICVQGVTCCVVEERKHSVVVMRNDNRLLLLPKKGLRFTIRVGETEFLIFGEGLKSNRFLKGHR